MSGIYQVLSPFKEVSCLSWWQKVIFWLWYSLWKKCCTWIRVL